MREMPPYESVEAPDSPITHLWKQKDVAKFLQVDVRTVQRLPIPVVAISVDPEKRPLPRYDPRDVHGWWEGQREQARTRREAGAARPGAMTPSPSRRRRSRQPLRIPREG